MSIVLLIILSIYFQLTLLILSSNDFYNVSIYIELIALILLNIYISNVKIKKDNLKKILILGIINSLLIIFMLLLNIYLIYLFKNILVTIIIISIIYMCINYFINKIMVKKLNIKNEKKVINNKRYVLLIGILMFIVYSFNSYKLLNNVLNYKTNDILITAHRGDSKNYPENTISSFQGALELNVDYIELDVHQTKDKKIVVIHDDNFKRTTGVNKYVYDMNYNEIEKLDAGYKYNEKFKGEKIPLFEDVLSFMQDKNIKLNVELKSSSKQDGLVSMVIKLINKYNFKDKVVIASFDYNLVKEVKSIDDSFKTVYLLSSVNKNIDDYTDADIFSINYRSINKELVDKIHDKNKKVYAWTVDDRYNINQMINYNVDSIITNDARFVKSIIDDRNENIISKIMK